MLKNLPDSLIFLIFLAGIVLVFSDSFGLQIRKLRRMSLLKNEDSGPSYTGKLFGYLENLLDTVLPKSRITPGVFAGICSCIFGAVLVLLFPALSVFAAFPAMFFAAVPVMVLRFRLEKIRNRGSQEAEQLVSGLLNCYRINHRNIFASMEEFISMQTDRCIITRGLVFQLLISIRNTKSEELIRRATERFSFALRTNWSRMLSVCIFAAASEGLDITESLEDILSQLGAARTLREEKKRSNTESVKMVQLFVPIAYFGSLLLGTMTLDVTVPAMLRNQFLEPAGLTFMFAIAGLFILNNLLLGLVKNSRFDY